MSVSFFFYIEVNLYIMGFPMSWKKVKQKLIKSIKKSSQEPEVTERVLWRPYNPWTLP